MEVSPTSYRTSPSKYEPMMQNKASTWSTPFSSTLPSASMYRSPQGIQSVHSSVLGNGDWKQKVNHLKKFFGDEYDPRKQFQIENTPYGHIQQQHVSSQFQKQSYQTMFENALLKNSIRDRCDEVTKLFQIVSITELKELFPLLLHDLFGYQNLPNWGLHFLEPRAYPSDYNAMKAFLAPKGTIFKIIDKLMTDHDAMFQLPFEILPSGISEAIMKNQIPRWYQHKIQNTLNGSVVVNFNALEYFFALFSHFVLHQKTLNIKNEWSGIEDVLYVHLFELYLIEYLPLSHLDNQMPNLSTSPTATSKQHGIKSTLWRSTDLKFAITKKMTSGQDTSPINHIDKFGHQATNTETFLQLITDFWLAFNSEEYIQKEEEYKLPSLDHSRMVRILVKYLHTYTNSCKRDTAVQSLGGGAPLEEFKKVFVPSMVYDKLYSYLLHCFNHWPLDGTFRMILETWLSFVQPWRYQPNHHNADTSMDNFDGEITAWRGFIQSNLHFYSGILNIFLLRALKFDLMSIQDVQLIYRVSKIFTLPCLMDILREEMEDSEINGGSYLSNPYTSQNTSLVSSFAQKQVENFASLPATSSLFNLQNNRRAQELCQRMSQTVIGLRHKICTAADKQKLRNNSWSAFFGDLFTVNDITDVSYQREEQRLIDYLQNSCKAFSELFKLSELSFFPGEDGGSRRVDTLNPSVPTPTLYNDETVPDHRVTEDGIELTDRGRYQMIQGSRRFDVVYSGDPEFQPLRSFESQFTVRVLYRIATRFNTKYGEKLTEFYNREDFLGQTLRRISLKGLNHEHYAESAIKLPSSRSGPAQQQIGVNRQIKPRVTLRFAGSYYFLGYFCWGIVLLRLFDFSWMSILLIGLLFVFVSILYHIDSPPKSSKQE